MRALRPAKLAAAVLALAAAPVVFAGAAATTPQGSHPDSHANRQSGSNVPAPSVYQLRPQWLAKSKAQIAAGDEVRQAALSALVKLADEARQGPDYSVTFNSVVPPSGDKRDYLSIGPYWWPDPASDNGLPWIRRDGEVNRAVRGENSDSHTLGQMTDAVMTLALAYYFTEDRVYAARAADMLRVFFLNNDTRMNPNLNFGQGIPGRTDGRGIGIIESRKLMRVADAIGLLSQPDADSQLFSATERQALMQWFVDFLQWLQTSPHGQDERDEHNNHGTFYDAQVVHLALFVGNRKLAQTTLAQVPERRINTHFAGNGSQPHELSRTRPFHYSAFNLQAYFALAQLAQHLDMNLWQHRTPAGGSLLSALDYLNHYGADSDIKHQAQRDDLVEQSADPGKLLALNQIAALIHQQPNYRQISLEILGNGQGNLECLLIFPSPNREQLAAAAKAQPKLFARNTTDRLCRY